MSEKDNSKKQMNEIKDKILGIEEKRRRKEKLEKKGISTTLLTKIPSEDKEDE